MRESRTYGSVRGARDETRVPTATEIYLLRCVSLFVGPSRQFQRLTISVAIGAERTWLDAL
jgi:hypothetical protein